MSRPLLTLLCVSSLAHGAAFAAEPGTFEMRAELSGEVPAGSPARVDLPRELLEVTLEGLSDLRVFDASGGETPYVIYEHQVAPPPTGPMSLKVVDYAEAGMAQTLLLELPAGAPAIQDLQLRSPERDFKAPVVVWGASERLNLNDTGWVELSTDTLFDYASRVPLRRDTLSLPAPAQVKFLKIGLDLEEGGSRRSGFRYEGGGLFSVRRVRQTRLKIDEVIAWPAPTEPRSVLYDSVTLRPEPGRTTDGVTTVDLGRINLPVDWLELEVGTPWFYREVRVMAAERDEPQRWRQWGEAVVYKVPEMQGAEVQFKVQLPEGQLVQLRFDDGDNPPLKVSGVKVGWRRRSLYFMPEAGARYALYFLDPTAHRPRYDTAFILPPAPGKLDTYPTLTLGSTTQNASFDVSLRGTDESSQARNERWALMAVVGALAAVMAVWGLRLLKTVTAPPEGGA